MMHFVTHEFAVWINTLGWSLLHSLWQGAVVAAALWLLLRLVPAAGARFRYNLALGALIITIAWFGFTVCNQWPSAQQIQARVAEPDAALRGSGIYLVAPSSSDRLSLDWLHHAAFILDQHFPVLMLAYTAGLMLMLFRMMSSIAYTWRLRRSNVQAPDAMLSQLLHRLQRTLRIDISVRLLCSARVATPMVIGMLKPVILLPAVMLTRLSTEQLEAILLHELAHIRRQDYLVNLLQTMAEMVLFFNPAVWMISSVIRREREHCCDDMVVAHTADPLHYATALAAVSSYFNAPATALGATGKSYHLLHRIKRIMTMKNHPLNRGRIVAAILVMLALTGATIWFTPSLAQNKKNPQTTKEAMPPQPPIPPPAEKPEQPEAPEAPEQPEGKSADVPTPPSTAFTQQQIADLQQRALTQASKAMKEANEKLLRNGGYQTPEQKAAMQEAMNAMREAQKGLADAQHQLNNHSYENASDAIGDAMDNTDWNYVDSEIAAATKAVEHTDWNKVEAEINAGLAEAEKAMNDPEAKRVLHTQIEKARAEAHRGLEEARTAQRVALEETRQARDKALQDAERLRAEAAAGRKKTMSIRMGVSSDYRDAMLDKMEAEGLLNREAGFSVEYNKGAL